MRYGKDSQESEDEIKDSLSIILSWRLGQNGKIPNITAEPLVEIMFAQHFDT